MDFITDYKNLTEIFTDQLEKNSKLIESERLWGLVVRVTGYTTEMYCVSCEVWTEFIYVM
jgi:hypothetical protein